MKNFYSALLAFAAGALLAFAYPNIFGKGFTFLAIVSFGFFYYQIFQEKKITNLLLQTFTFCLGFSTLGFYWIPQTLSTFGGIPLIFGYIISVFFSLIVLPHLWLQIFFYYHLKKLNLPKNHFLICIAIGHVIFEQIIPSQFSVWIGHSMLSSETVLPLTSYFGASIYSLSLMLIAIFIPHLKFNSIKLNSLKSNFPLLIGIGIIVIDLIIGLNTFYPSSVHTTSNENFKLRIVQANIGNFMKISSEKGEFNSVKAVYEQYEQLSFREPVNYDLLIWPETAVPTLFHSKKWQDLNFINFPYMQKIIDQLPPHVGFVFGGYDEGKLNEYNTAFYYQNQKLETYYKIKLIPFGETLPFGKWNEKLSPFFPGVSLFAQGSDLNFFHFQKNKKFITPICYELLDTNFMRSFLNTDENIQFIINLTNDSWYGDTAEPWQHLFLTRWRALEFRKPIIRSTNTGITTVIDEQAKISNYLDIDEKNNLDLNIFVHENTTTFYQRWGNYPLNILLIIIVSIYLLRPAFIKSCKRKTPSKV